MYSILGECKFKSEVKTTYREYRSGKAEQFEWNQRNRPAWSKFLKKLSTDYKKIELWPNFNRNPNSDAKLLTNLESSSLWGLLFRCYWLEKKRISPLHDKLMALSWNFKEAYSITSINLPRDRFSAPVEI